MKNLKNFLEYQIKYLYSWESQMEELLSELEKECKTPKAKSYLYTHKEKAKMNKNRLDALCIDIFIDPRGIYSKLLFGLSEDIQNLLIEKNSFENTEMAIIENIQNLAHYNLAAYRSLYKTAIKLKYFNTANKIEDIIEEYKEDEVSEVTTT